MFWLALAATALAAGTSAADTTKSNPAASKALPAETLNAVNSKGIAVGAPVYIRIFKEESELEIWQRAADGRYRQVKTFPICTWSGTLGPKRAQGDFMSPEGFYDITVASLKPDSKYHLAFNIGYPNALDRALGRTGDFIMVHGNCVSVGCFAMTDTLMEEIYAFARGAFEGGAVRVPVHIFPFRMSALNLNRHAANPDHETWAPLKEAYDDFAQTFEPPRVGLCGKRYVVNPRASVGFDPQASCPTRIGKLLSPVSPSRAMSLLIESEPIVASGPKTKTLPSPVAPALAETGHTKPQFAPEAQTR